MANEKHGEQAPTSQQTQKALQASQDAFVQHLEQASSVVKTWPDWKQQILGGAPTNPKGNSNAKQGNAKQGRI